MAGKGRMVVIVRLKDKEPDENFSALVERLRAMGTDVIIVEADEAMFPNILTVDQAVKILKQLGEDLKKRLN